MKVPFHDIYFDCDELEVITNEIKEKIDKIKSCYDEVKSKSKMLYGTNDIWQGKDQREYYEGLEMITECYDSNIERLTERYQFLKDIIDSYRAQEEQAGKTLDDNNDNLDM